MRITVALDVRIDAAGRPCVALHGWKDQSVIEVEQVLKPFLTEGLTRVLCTDIARDGMMTGPNHELYASLMARFPRLEFQASGGVSKLEGSSSAQKGRREVRHRGQGDLRRRHRPQGGDRPMLTKRIIACLDVKDGKVVKGTQFRGHEVVGEILELARRYRDEGVDELVFYDITASAEDRRVSRKWVEDVARVIDVPFCVAGGIRTVADAREVLNSGADKISINSPALENPGLISELARVFGNQCVVVGVDSKKQDGGYFVYCYTGSEAKTRLAGRKTMHWISEAQAAGAGEIVLNCMNQDGTGAGYDIEQLKQARKLLVHSARGFGRRAKSVEHFENVFKEAHVDAALAAELFTGASLRSPRSRRRSPAAESR